MNKFASKLASTNKEIRTERAQQVSELVELQQAQLVGELRTRLITQRAELTSLFDLGADNTQSLRAVSKDFDAASWVRLVQAKKIDLVTTEVELKLAQDTLNEWFVTTNEEVSNEQA